MFLHLVGHLIGQVRGRRAGADAVLEDVRHVVIAGLEERARLFEVLLGFARKADDHVGRKIHLRLHRPQRVHDLPVTFARVRPVHRAENPVAAALHRQVHVAAEFRQPTIGGDEVVFEAARVRRGEPDPLDAVDRVHAFQQLHEGRDAAGVRVIAPAVAGHDLAQQGDLAHAAFGQRPAFRDDVVHRPGTLVAPGLGHDAERAIHVAALLDGNECRDLPLGPDRAVFLRPGGQVILDRVLRAGFFRDIDDGGADRQSRLAGRAQVVEIARHLVKFLRADDQVEVGQLFEQRRPAVLRHATEDPEHEVRLLPLALLEVTRLADRLLLGRVAHAAGVEQQDVAVVLVRHDPIAPGTQHRRDRFAVALVHLTTVRFDVDAVQFREGS